MKGPWYRYELAAEKRYLYNGKELNADLGLEWLDYGARFYDPAIGRFTGVDPLVDNYFMWGTFSLSFDNPLRFVDPDGRSAEDLILRYKENSQGCKCLETFISQINQNFAGQLEAVTEQVYDAKGNVVEGHARLRIVPTGEDLNKLSEGARAFYSGLTAVTENSSFSVTINLVSADADVAVGNYDRSAIDVDDVAQFPVLGQKTDEQPGPTQAGKILHEVREQTVKQVVQGLRPGQEGSIPQKEKAHQSGILFENSVNGNTRLPDVYTRHGAIQKFEMKNGVVNKYHVGTNTRIVSVKKI